MKFTLLENREGKAIPEFETTLEVKIVGNELVFDFYAKNSTFNCVGNAYNAKLYNGDVCEAYVCTLGDLNNYYEIEVSPNNNVFFKEVFNYGDDEQRRAASMENYIKSSTEIIGNDYKVKFSVPLDKIGYKKEVGIKFNAFRIETEGIKTDKNLLAVSPTLCSKFHRPQFFIEYKD